MRRWKLVAAATAASAVLAGGMFAAFNLTAKAATEDCTYTPSDGTTPTCQISDYEIDYPETISFTVLTTPGSETVNLNWSLLCYSSTDSGVSAGPTTYTASVTTPPEPSGSTTTEESTTYNVTTLPGAYTDPLACVFESATATAVTTGDPAPATVTYLELDINYTAQPTASATPSPTPTATATTPTTTAKYNNQVHGFDGTCLDDKGNSSAKRTSVIIWTCSNTDQAQGWTYSGSELKIHGMCLNAKGSGKQGSKLILWNCTGSGNEIFSHRSNGEFVEKANGYSQCIDDPGYSTKNGTQPFMYKCNNGANQHWSLP
jgi:hypothetical protein